MLVEKLNDIERFYIKLVKLQVGVPYVWHADLRQ